MSVARVFLGGLAMVVVLSGCGSDDDKAPVRPPSPAESATATATATPEPLAFTSDRGVTLTLDAPVTGRALTSPLEIHGRVTGTWMFEASFPVDLVDAEGRQIVAHYAQADGEWMTSNDVPFTIRLTFAEPRTDTGMLILRKDNPSGEKAHDDQIEIPVRFR